MDSNRTSGLHRKQNFTPRFSKAPPRTIGFGRHPVHRVVHGGTVYPASGEGKGKWRCFGLWALGFRWKRESAVASEASTFAKSSADRIADRSGNGAGGLPRRLGGRPKTVKPRITRGTGWGEVAGRRGWGTPATQPQFLTITSARRPRRSAPPKAGSTLPLPPSLKLRLTGCPRRPRSWSAKGGGMAGDGRQMANDCIQEPGPVAPADFVLASTILWTEYIRTSVISMATTTTTPSRP